MVLIAICTILETSLFRGRAIQTSLFGTYPVRHKEKSILVRHKEKSILEGETENLNAGDSYSIVIYEG